MKIDYTVEISISSPLDYGHDENDYLLPTTMFFMQKAPLRHYRDFSFLHAVDSQFQYQSQGKLLCRIVAGLQNTL